MQLRRLLTRAFCLQLMPMPGPRHRLHHVSCISRMQPRPNIPKLPLSFWACAPQGLAE